MQACILVIFSLIVALTSGCERHISKDNLEVVNRLYEKNEKTGRPLSKKEVESILGQPSRIEAFTMTRPATKEYPGERYIYVQNGKEMVLHFVEGNLAEKATEFGATEPSTAQEAQAPFHRNPTVKSTPVNISEPPTPTVAPAPVSPAPAPADR